MARNPGLRCYVCDRVKERIYYNHPTTLVLCNICYDTIIRKEKHTLDRRIQDKKRFRYKDKRLRSKREPRIGVCNECRAVVPFDCAKTFLHHEVYDDSDPNSNVIELCGRCHNEAGERLKQFMKHRDISKHG